MSKDVANITAPTTVAMPEALTIFQVSDIYTSLKEVDLTQPVELDFIAVEEMDSAGFQLLIALYKQLKEHDAALSFVNVSESIEEVFKLFNFPFTVSEDALE